jgi:hypothetical protein
MISQNPENSSESKLEGKSPQSNEPKLGDASVDSKLDQWMDRISDDWMKTVKKVSKSKSLTKASKKTAKRMCFGLTSELVDKAQPLIAHIGSGAKATLEFEQLASLAESICSSIQSIEHGELDSHSQEVFDAYSKSNEHQLLAAFSSLLVAMKLREAVLNGTDLQFERIIRSLQNLQCCVSAASEEDAVLLHQWLAIELPMVIASQLTEIKVFKKEGKQAAKRFVEVTRNLLDSDGWPGSNCLTHFGALVASWTRCVKLAEACKYKLGSSFLAQLEWVAEQFIRLHGPKGRLVLSGDSATKTDPAFAEFVMNLAAADTRTLATAAVSGLLGSKGTDVKKIDIKSLSDATCVSEWAQSAILRSSWKPKSSVVAIDFSDPQCRIELAAKDRLLSGILQLEVRDDGEPVALDKTGFDVVCELDDEEVSYIELEIQQSGIQMFRQLLLSKKDKFLFFADSVSKKNAGEIDYRLKLPLAMGVDVIPENGTREMYLNRKGKGIRSLVLPISLPEWSAERCRGLFLPEESADNGGKLLSVEKSIQLRSEGGALYSPLFFDLDPERSRQKRTWRSLTVAESLSIVKPEVASAYRVQVAEQQWVFYRALQSIGNRTFMGQNFSGDFYAGRFFNDGLVGELVQVE